MTIGILTFHRALNCGAMLQAWALKHELESFGHAVGFIPNHVGEVARWVPFPKSGSVLGRCKGTLLSLLKNAGSFGSLDLNRTRFNQFREDHLPEIQIEECDLIIVGSDQVWRSDLTGPETPLFRGASVRSDVPMIAYAASIGDSIPTEEACRLLVSDLARFRAVAVREYVAVESLARGKAGFPVCEVVDPTLLLKRSDYASITTPPREKGPYLFAYTIHATPAFVRFARDAARRLGLRLVITSACQYTRWGAPLGLTYGVSPDRMLGYISDAACVVASSFHGAALSFILGKPFVSYREKRSAVESRPETLLRHLNLSNRLIYPDTEKSHVDQCLSDDNLCEANVLRENLRNGSRAWLKTQLEVVP